MTSKDTPNNNGEIPKGCTSWYDGCNTCSVRNGKLEACTLMYCETPGTPKCTEYR